MPASLEQTRVALEGSDRAALPGARFLAPANPGERLEITVVVRPTQGAPTARLEQGSQEPKQLTHEEFEQAYGAAPADLQLVESFAHEHGLTVIEASRARRAVVLGGTVASFADAFGVQLGHYSHAGRTYRGREGKVYVPKELAGVVEAVLGLDDRAQARTHIRRKAGFEPHAGSRTFTPPEVAQLYDFPGLDGGGECIGILELGGGYRPSDLRTYFRSIEKPLPRVIAIGVDGAHNAPSGNPDGDDGEVMLDIEVAGAVAPRAQIAVYFAPNTDRGFLDALTTAVHDKVRKPSVISISWGGPEAQWTPQAMTAFDNAIAAAALLGVTVCCSSGDDGSSDGMTDSKSHVDFPASSPHALACGGTRLAASGIAITREEAWNDASTGGGATGGGVSNVFALPAWQKGSNVPPSGRGVPDVAGDADPDTGYRVRIDGVDTVVGGTSAVSPLWAGLLTLINQKRKAGGLQTVGFLQPRLYSASIRKAAFHDVTLGNNGAFHAGPGWDACTGLGTPDGKKLVDLLASAGPS